MPEIPILLPHFMQEALEEKERRRQRPYMECSFPEEMSFESFCDIAESARRSIKGRKIQLSIEGPVVHGDVESRSGLSAWPFEIDFNDYGQITGRYWLYSGNDDSVIPEHMANMIREGIKEALEAGKKEEAEVVEPEYYCPNCNANLRKQQGFDPANHVWVCKGCGMQLFDDTISGNVIWYCDSCGSVLNTQEGFSENTGTWKCTQCGFENSVSEEDHVD